MKDKELEEILDKVAVEAVAIMLAGKAELYIPTVKKYEQKLLAWRDKAVREARVQELNKLSYHQGTESNGTDDMQVTLDYIVYRLKELSDEK